MFKYLLFILGIGLCQAGVVIYSPETGVEGKIVGGQDVDITQLPYQLSLEEKGLHVCGASIISTRFALTAAHCVDGSKMSDLRLRAGTSVLNNGGTVHPAVSFSIHPEFDKNSFAYDLALIQVSPEFKYDSLRQPVFLPTKEPDENSMGTVSGWGPTQENGDDSAQLQAVTVPFINKEICATVYASEGYEVTDTMLCAGTLGKDFCDSDHGGPIVIGETQYGIASWGLGCGRPNTYGVYTNLAQSVIRLWIFTIAGI